MNEFQDRRTMQEIVLNARTVAIVGLSASELRELSGSQAVELDDLRDRAKGLFRRLKAR